LEAQLKKAKSATEKERLISEIEVTTAKVTEVTTIVTKLETRIAGVTAQSTEWTETYKANLTGLTTKFKEVKTAETTATKEVATAVKKMPMAPADPVSLPPLEEENPPALRKAVVSLAKEFGFTENKPFRIVSSLSSGRVLTVKEGKTVTIDTKDAGKETQLFCFDP
jgi:hypothetical protein